MDPERQPLLNPTVDLRSRRTRPLTSEEVIIYSHDASWRRARFCIKFFFWAILAMFLSVITCLLMQAPDCYTYSGPTVPPVHMTLAPLISSVRTHDDGEDGKPTAIFELAWFV